MVTQKPNVNPSDKYTIAKAAKVLGCSRWTIYQRIRDKEISYHVSINGRLFLSGSDIITFWNTQCF